MPISRRALLSTIPAATLLAAARPLRARAATPPAPAASTDHATIIGNTVAMFAGTSESNARSEVAGKLAAIRTNAIATLAVQKEAGSLSDFLWAFVDHKPVLHRLASYRDAQTSSPVSDAMAKALKKRGFSFLGTTTLYAFMQSVGMVNDHETTCFRYRQLRS